MAKRHNRGTARYQGAPAGKPARPGRAPESKPTLLGMPRPIAAGLAGLLVVIVLAVGAFVVLSGNSGNGPNAPAAYATVSGAKGGYWTNVSSDQLASMLDQKDFTLLNVKTPYIGEISGTDLYIPYNQLTARQSELPASKSAKVVVYCRSGAESAQAAQILLDLGYTNIWNLDGGMNAWQQSGRKLIQLNR